MVTNSENVRSAAEQSGFELLEIKVDPAGDNHGVVLRDKNGNIIECSVDEFDATFAKYR